MQLADLETTCRRNAEGPRFGDAARAVSTALEEIFKRLRSEAAELFAGAKRKSGLLPRHRRQPLPQPRRAGGEEPGVRYDMLLNVFDRSIIEVENRVYGDGDHSANLLCRRTHVSPCRRHWKKESISS